MTASAPTPDRNRPSRQSPLLLALLLLGVAASASLTWLTRATLAAQQGELAALRATLDDVLGEVTRLRVEQSAKSKGPKGLLEKLAVYAPLAANSRTTEPDFENAKAELVAIIRAFESIGSDAWAPVQERLASLDTTADFDQIKWLLEASMHIDPLAGKQQLKEVLLGQRMPNPRLRWWAAELLLRNDKPLAADLLRRILLTESSRGVNPDRIGQYPGMAVPDAAAFAQTGFNNFVQKYLRTDDDRIEETLLLLLGRVEHDSITIQDCVKELGRRRCARAVAPIQQLYANPPLQQQNPLFLIHCVRAVHEILADGANDWLEQVVANAPTPEVAKVANELLGR